jgi:hypothetical protein
MRGKPLSTDRVRIRWITKNIQKHETVKTLFKRMKKDGLYSETTYFVDIARNLEKAILNAANELELKS